MKRLLYIIIFFYFFLNSEGQSLSRDVSVELLKLFSKLENNFDDNSRLKINDSIKIIIGQYASSDSVFAPKFENIRFLGQLLSSDRQLKIITWNLTLTDSPNRYFCFFIRKGDKKRPNSVYSLTGINSDKPIRIDTPYYENNWYGALYYGLRPVKIKKDIYYVLLGIDFGNKVINRKVIDVLSFTADGRIIFGKKWFAAKNEVKFRDVFEYDANGVMSLKFYTGKSIVFDHLVKISSKNPEKQRSFGAEYSYDSYNYKGGIWKLNINVDVRNNE
jgi:hypothetical protein